MTNYESSPQRVARKVMSIGIVRKYVKRFVLRWAAKSFDSTTLPALSPYIREGCEFLDLGTGAATVARWATRKGAIVTATDIDLSNVVRGPGEVAFLQHDITTDSLDEGKYDVIFARNVLCQVPEGHELIINKLASALKATGVLIVIDGILLPLDNPSEKELAIARAQRDRWPGIRWAEQGAQMMTRSGLRVSSEITEYKGAGGGRHRSIWLTGTKTLPGSPRLDTAHDL